MRGDGEVHKTISGSGASHSQLIHSQLIRDEIQAIVADAISFHQILRVGLHAQRLSVTYPGSGLSPRWIADELILAASHAKVPVKIDSA
jgi:hypothetical protein